MRTSALLPLLLILLVQVAYSYPIEPRPLRKLVMESKFIVVGFVESVENVEPPISKKNKWRETYSVASIRIREVLQGELLKR
jgi:hypothetical protein